MSETDEAALDEVDITDVPSVGEHDPEDLTDEEEVVAQDDEGDDGVDIGVTDDPTRPESGMVPAPPADDQEES